MEVRCDWPRVLDEGQSRVERPIRIPLMMMIKGPVPIGTYEEVMFAWTCNVASNGEA